ncbi:hypothetical protein [Ahniella affigens]|nr:hypothetical protein [Ahniella affigens]
MKISDRCTAWRIEDIRALIERTAKDAEAATAKSRVPAANQNASE